MISAGSGFIPGNNGNSTVPGADSTNGLIRMAVRGRFLTSTSNQRDKSKWQACSVPERELWHVLPDADECRYCSTGSIVDDSTILYLERTDVGIFLAAIQSRSIGLKSRVIGTLDLDSNG